MITFKDARAKIDLMADTLWKNHGGTFYVSPDGWGDSTHWLLTYGAEEWLVDEDPRFVLLDEGLVLVRKSDGDVQTTTYLDDPDRYDAMRDVSVG